MSPALAGRFLTTRPPGKSQGEMLSEFLYRRVWCSKERFRLEMEMNLKLTSPNYSFLNYKMG